MLHPLLHNAVEVPTSPRQRDSNLVGLLWQLFDKLHYGTLVIADDDFTLLPVHRHRPGELADLAQRIAATRGTLHDLPNTPAHILQYTSQLIWCGICFLYIELELRFLGNRLGVV